ncbi:hypothetical protein VTI74DRAFT_3516 [Chaetomium olivicolor]
MDAQDTGRMSTAQQSHAVFGDGVISHYDTRDEPIDVRTIPRSLISHNSPTQEEQGREKGPDTALTTTLDKCRLAALPAELIATILSYVSPVDLCHVSATCRTLYKHATDDHLWQALVQRNVPGQRVTSPYPYTTFRALFGAHDPRWFLPKYKIWFSDTGFPGRLLLVRYDQRRGCIEGYQLVARKTNNTFHTWGPNHNSIISSFDPEVKLHLDNPVIRLSADPLNDPHDTEGTITTFTMRRRSNSMDDESIPEISTSQWHSQTQILPQTTRFQPQIPMSLTTIGHLKSSFIHARALGPDDEIIRHLATSSFPYNYAWPPPSIPASHRILGAGVERASRLRPRDTAARRSEVCDRAFRVRKWIEMPVFHHGLNVYLVPPPTVPLASMEVLEWEQQHQYQQQDGSVGEARRMCIGEEVATYATLEPEWYTPTEEKPWQGIWVGDYGGHGCEFLWVRQPDDEEPGGGGGEGEVTRLEGEVEEEWERGKREARVYRGRLEAVKLTGDVNVPRGECTFVVDDLGEGGFVRVEEEAPFEGVRVVKSRGHIANQGFLGHSYTDGELMLISHDRLAHNWTALGHISYYQRVDIDQFLAL